MGLFQKLFGQESPQAVALALATKHAVTLVEPLLLQTSAYPERFIHPVSFSLEYARHLAFSLPGPVTVDRESYAHDALVHALFPGIDSISDAIVSSVDLQDFLRHHPGKPELYALMGMRRVEKKIMGMEVAGMTVQREIVQHAMYFSSHTLEAPSLSESDSREKIALRFFDKLVGKVRQRIEQRKDSKSALAEEQDHLLMRLRSADPLVRSELEARMQRLTEGLGTIIASLEPDSYAEDFDAILLHPEEHLRLDTGSVVLDSMGIKRADDDTEYARSLTFSELVGYDRRDWIVTMVRCTNLQHETFAERLDQAYRRLSL